MISPTIATVLGANASAAERQDACDLPSAATNTSSQAPSFSSAMANAAATSPTTETANSEGCAAPASAPASFAACDGAPSDAATASSGEKTAASEGAPTLAGAGRSAAAAARTPVPNGASVTAKSQVPAARAGSPLHASSTKALINPQTSAKGDTDKASSDGDSAKSTAADPGASTASGNIPNSAAPQAALPAAGSSVDALATLSIAQAASADRSASRADDGLGPVPDSSTTDIAAARSLNHVDAMAQRGIASALTEDPSAGASELDTAAGTLAASPLPSFATLFGGGAAKAGVEPAEDNALSSIADATAASPGAAAPLPTAVLATLAGTMTHNGTAVGFGPVQVDIRTAVNDPGFGQDVSRQIVYLAKTGVQSAELSLQPADLGPVSVSIQMNGLQASLVISASHAATRAALQDALPHLSELFQSSGLQLTGAQVGDGSQRNADQWPAKRNSLAVDDPLGPNASARPAPIALAATASATGSGNRLIDTFA